MKQKYYIDDFDSMFNELPEKKEEIFKNINLSEKMSSVIYLGIPTQKGRNDIWEFLLDIKLLYNTTKKNLNLQIYLEKKYIMNIKEEIMK